MKNNELHNLELLAAKARKLLIETNIRAGCGHPGGALSSMEIMIALYFKILKINPQNPLWNERDRFILSKGHGTAALYAVFKSECLKIKHHFNHFALRSKIYLKALRSAFDELQALKTA